MPVNAISNSQRNKQCGGEPVPVAEEEREVAFYVDVVVFGVEIRLGG